MHCPDRGQPPAYNRDGGVGGKNNQVCGGERYLFGVISQSNVSVCARVSRADWSFPRCNWEIDINLLLKIDL